MQAQSPEVKNSAYAYCVVPVAIQWVALTATRGSPNPLWPVTHRQGLNRIVGQSTFAPAEREQRAKCFRHAFSEIGSIGRVVLDPSARICTPPNAFDEEIYFIEPRKQCTLLSKQIVTCEHDERAKPFVFDSGELRTQALATSTSLSMHVIRQSISAANPGSCVRKVPMSESKKSNITIIHRHMALWRRTTSQRYLNTIASSNRRFRLMNIAFQIRVYTTPFQMKRRCSQMENSSRSQHRAAHD